MINSYTTRQSLPVARDSETPFSPIDIHIIFTMLEIWDAGYELGVITDIKFYCYTSILNFIFIFMVARLRNYLGGYVFT